MSNWYFHYASNCIVLSISTLQTGFVCFVPTYSSTSYERKGITRSGTHQTSTEIRMYEKNLTMYFLANMYFQKSIYITIPLIGFFYSKAIKKSNMVCSPHGRIGSRYPFRNRSHSLRVPHSGVCRIHRCDAPSNG